MRKLEKLIQVLIIQSEAQLEINKMLAEKIAILELKLQDK